MKIILCILLSLLTGVIQAQTCDNVDEYTIYYGNGVLAEPLNEELKNVILLREAVGSTFNGKKINWALSYNKSDGWLDFLQSIRQKQIEYYSNFHLWLHQVGLAPQWFIDIAEENLLKTSISAARDIDRHAHVYQSSLTSGQRVLVVPHSQGNFYANEAKKLLATRINSSTAQAFGIFGVAVPTSNVGGAGGPYYTNHRDIIQKVPTSLPTNWQLKHSQTKVVADDVDELSAHFFADTYISPAYDIKEALAQGIKASLEKLADPIPPCPEPPPEPPTSGFQTYLPAQFSGYSIAAAICGKWSDQTGSLTIGGGGSVTGAGCFDGVSLAGKSNYGFNQTNRDDCVGACITGFSITFSNGFFASSGPSLTAPDLRIQQRDGYTADNLYFQQASLTANGPLSIDIEKRIVSWLGAIENVPCEFTADGSRPAGPVTRDHRLRLDGSSLNLLNGTTVVRTWPLTRIGGGEFTESRTGEIVSILSEGRSTEERFQLNTTPDDSSNDFEFFAHVPFDGAFTGPDIACWNIER